MPSVNAEVHFDVLFCGRRECVYVLDGLETCTTGRRFDGAKGTATTSGSYVYTNLFDRDSSTFKQVTGLRARFNFTFMNSRALLHRFRGLVASFFRLAITLTCDYVVGEGYRRDDVVV